MAYAVLKGERLATDRMTPQELEVVQEISDMMKTRHLMKEYHLKYWEIDEIPYQVLDQLLKLDKIEAAVLSEPKT